MKTILLMAVLLTDSDTAKATYACHWTEHAGGTREVTGLVEGDFSAVSPADALAQAKAGCEARRATCSAYVCGLKQ